MQFSPSCFPGQSSSLFQSSPGQKAGCNSRIATRIWLAPLFQSSPGQKAGCNLITVVHTPRLNIGVSILTRPEGRMQSPKTLYIHVHCVSFNPHPARRPDAML